jgi:hypothetical protein
MFPFSKKPNPKVMLDDDVFEINEKDKTMRSLRNPEDVRAISDDEINRLKERAEMQQRLKKVL